VAEEAAAHLRTSQQVWWAKHLDQEHGNLRAALEWALGRGEIETALRLGAALWFYWILRGRFTEGRGWLAALLARRDAAPPAVRARALLAAGSLAWLQGDLASAPALLEESVECSQQAGDQWGLGVALTFLGGVTMAHGEPMRAQALIEEAVVHSHEAGESWALGSALFGQAMVAGAQGNGEAARQLLEKSIALLRSVGERWMLSLALSSAGELAVAQEDYEAAGDYFEEAAATAREIDSAVASLAGSGAGAVALLRGDYARAAAVFAVALAEVRDVGHRRGMAFGLMGLAGAAAGQGRAVRAARLLGAAGALQAAIGFAMDAIEHAVHDRAATSARGDLGEKVFLAAYAEGEAMTLERAVAYALEETVEELRAAA
jgi:tetratricopeptide (TPR) repeat protein